MTGHSEIGASGAHRWMRCPGSVRLSRNAPASRSAYAAEGTVAHDLAEKHLLGELDIHQLHLPQQREADGYTVTVDQEMIDAVAVYVEHCRGLQADPAQGEKYPEAVELRFHLKHLHHNLYGTADFVLYDHDTRTLYVRDYKHGAGVAVEARENPQLLYYALGAALDESFGGRPIETVDIGIVQPRCPHPEGPIRTWRIDPVELMEFSGELLDAVAATEAPDAPLVPGEHCRFCPAAGLPCPALAQRAHEMAAEEFREDLSYDPEKLAETLEWLPVFEGWIKSVRELAYNEAEHGRCPPRHKLVPKRAVRKWRDEATAVEALSAYGLDDEDLYSRKLKSPAQVEKIVGKANKGDIEYLITAESSGHTLVPESDPREPVRPSAADDFA